MPSQPRRSAFLRRGGVEVNSINFPDETFRSYVSERFDSNNNGALSEEEIAEVKSIYVNSEGIQDLAGIEYFTELKYLYCDGNKLTSLDLSKNTALTRLYCESNELTDLGVSGCTALDYLYCGDNKLTSLDVSKNTVLTELWCQDNQLTSLDVSKNTALMELGCYNNKLTSLDVSGCTALIHLECIGNKLTSLDLSKNTEMYLLHCGGNKYCIGKPAKTFDLSRLPEGFDPKKASKWVGAEYDPETNSLINITGDTITYTYDCGYKRPAKFTLCFNNLGDIDLDGDIDNDDIDALLEILFGNKQPNDNCDLNGDGTVNIFDLIILKRMLIK